MLDKLIENAVYLVFIGAFLSAIGAYFTTRSQDKENAENKKLYKQIAESALKNVDKVEENNKLYRELNHITQQNSKTQAENDQKVIELQQNLIKKQEELDKKAAAQNEKTDIINQKTEQIAKLSLELAESQKESSIAQKELIIAQKKAIEFSSESLNYLTGGNSWCYITISPNTGSKPNLNLHHVGQYPLSALRIRITYNSAIYRKSNKDAPGNGPYHKGLVMSGAYTTVLPVGPLPKGFVEYSFGAVPFEANIDESYSIQFSAQNGVWYQNYSITYDANKQPITTYKVFRDGKELMSYPQ